MAQFDVFVNPRAQARRAYPYLTVMQSDLAETGRDRMVAPLAPKARITAPAGRVAPQVRVSEIDLVLLVPRMEVIDVAQLRELRGRLTSYRDEIVAALDHLFLGV